MVVVWVDCLWQKVVITLMISFFQLEEYYEPVTKDDNVVSMVTDGTCYFDVEPEEVRQSIRIDNEPILQDDWIRIQVERGDLIVIPKGLSHRFTITPKVINQYSSLLHRFPFRTTSRCSVSSLSPSPLTRIKSRLFKSISFLPHSYSVTHLSC